MARKRHTAEEIVAKLRQVDVLMVQGRLVADAVLNALSSVPMLSSTRPSTKERFAEASISCVENGSERTEPAERKSKQKTNWANLLSNVAAPTGANTIMGVLAVPVTN